jgi:hypothetical protein
MYSSRHSRLSCILYAALLFTTWNGVSLSAKRALTRIFRMYDQGHDGLLVTPELDRFQRETYHVAVFDRDLAAWKR